mgnify:CR=1 FL=1
MNGLLAAGHHLKNNNIPLLQLAGFRTLARKPCDRSFALRRLWAQSLYLIAKNICCTFVQTIPNQCAVLVFHVDAGLARGIRGQCWRLRAESIWSVFSIYLFSNTCVCNLVYFCVLAASNATVSIARAWLSHIILFVFQCSCDACWYIFVYLPLHRVCLDRGCSAFTHKLLVVQCMSLFLTNCRVPAASNATISIAGAWLLHETSLFSMHLLFCSYIFVDQSALTRPLRSPVFGFHI